MYILILLQLVIIDCLDNLRVEIPQLNITQLSNDTVVGETKDVEHMATILDAITSSSTANNLTTVTFK